ncbi:hypothetical protein POTOM_050562 [Populus tomentosa]|uniref:Uncharacterized protein n=1 Tax=Populus tomentosa TaxID=118781 RepID=A0A8X7YIW7_POPTO|nr:hypothetical protein POTOM_050562 [Populus tomentosa]
MKKRAGLDKSEDLEAHFISGESMDKLDVWEPLLENDEAHADMVDNVPETLECPCGPYAGNHKQSFASFISPIADPYELQEMEANQKRLHRGRQYSRFGDSDGGCPGLGSSGKRNALSKSLLHHKIDWRSGGLLAKWDDSKFRVTLVDYGNGWIALSGENTPLGEVSKIVESIWRRKSRQQWCSLSDQNTKFFHLMANRRGREKFIMEALHANRIHRTPSEIKSAATSYFTNLCSRPNIHEKSSYKGYGLREVEYGSVSLFRETNYS